MLATFGKIYHKGYFPSYRNLLRTLFSSVFFCKKKLSKIIFLIEIRVDVVCSPLILTDLKFLSKCKKFKKYLKTKNPDFCFQGKNRGTNMECMYE